MAAALVPPSFDEAEETEAPLLPPAFDEAADTDAPLTAPAWDEAEDVPAPAAPTSNLAGDIVKRVASSATQATMQIGRALMYVDEKLNPMSLLNKAVFGPADPRDLMHKEVVRFATDVQEAAPAELGVDPAREGTWASKIAAGAGTVLPILASGPAAPYTAAALMGESQREEAEAAGAGEGKQAAAFVGGSAIGALSELTLGIPALLRSAKAVATTGKGTVREVVEQTAKGVVRESAQESLEQIGSNITAKAIYDPERGVLEGVPEAAVVGAAIGGPLGAVVQGAASADARATQALTSELESDIAALGLEPVEQAAPEVAAPTADAPPISTESLIAPAPSEIAAPQSTEAPQAQPEPAEETSSLQTQEGAASSNWRVNVNTASGKNRVLSLEATSAAEAEAKAAQTEGVTFVHKDTARPLGEPSVEPDANDWTQATSTLPSLETPTTPAEPEKAATPMGILPPGSQQLSAATAQLGAGIKKTVSAIKNIATFHDFRRSLLNWSGRNQKSSGEIHKAGTDILKAIPDETKRAAITNWIQAGGDTAVLQQRAAGSKDLKLRKGYQAALNLSPNEVALAQKVRQTYDTLLKRAAAHGIEINELENYVNQIWKRQPLRDFAASSNRRLSESIRFAKKRYYASFFDGEQAGLKPETKDISKLLPIYINEVNNAISAKQFVAEMSKGKAADGRPLLAPRGGARTIEGEGEVHLVFPEQATKDTSDYKVLAQPALHAWRWRGADENGNPIMVQGDLAVHPDAYSHLKNVLGQSALREWYRSPSENPLSDISKATVKFLVDDVQQVAKATMLGFLSPFHQVQEGTHAIGHKVNPFGGIPKINLSDPAQMDAAQHGLMLLPDRVSSQQFREGLDGSSRNILSNLLGVAGGAPGKKLKEWADGYQHYLFHEYIPGLKLKTYDHILERNSKRYEKEMAGGEVSLDQVKYLSAQQSNAAYGHLNYADMGRNPTMQHLAQTLLLAPDFLEARGRFAGQAVKGALTKSGREQAVALMTLGATQFILARILNQLLDDDPHWDHPFEVIRGNRRYTMRSVPEDIYKAFTNTRRFITGRLSPLIGRGTLEGLSGVNYRGEPTDFSATISNILAGFVPMTIQPATRGLTETGRDNPVSPFEQLLGSSGLHVSRFSAVSEVYSLSKDWVEKHGKEYGLDKRRAVYPISEYQQLRYALDDGDFERAKEEAAKLMESKKITKQELSKRFRGSINHPFTGTVRTDKAFYDSLDERGKKIYNAAKARRVLLIQRLGKAL